MGDTPDNNVLGLSEYCIYNRNIDMRSLAGQEKADLAPLGRW
jgi:hypothetical protein